MAKLNTSRLSLHTLLLLLLLQLLSSVRANAAGITSSAFSNGSIGDLLWLDRNGNGLQDSGEPGFEGAQVILQDASGVIISTTVTDAFGNYSFVNVETGTAGSSYQVWFRLPSGFRFSPRSGTMSDAGNSDVSESTGKTPVFTLLPGQAMTNVDAGLINASIGTLPLHTFHLTSLLSGSAVSLKFVAENEMNTHHFVVERSVDGINYADIATVAVTGPVNTPTTYYVSTDVLSVSSYSVVYYRIRAEDNFSRSAYSNVAPIRLNKIAGIRTWPNPFVNEIRISYNGTANSQVDVQLADNAGRIVWQGNFEISRGLNQLSISGMERLPSGIYFIRVTDKTTMQNFVERMAK